MEEPHDFSLRKAVHGNDLICKSILKGMDISFQDFQLEDFRSLIFSSI